MLTKPPLNFIGNKGKFGKIFREELEDKFDESYIYVDLFGGSGYLSYLVKYTFPNARVIYNDYDNYFERLQHIGTTNELLKKIQAFIDSKNYKHNEKIKPGDKEEIVKMLDEIMSENEYLDVITISAQILFSGNATNNYEQLKKTTFYNRINKNFLDISAVDKYMEIFEKIERRRCDYKELLEEFEGKDDVVYLCDPPYLFTNCDTYSVRNSGEELLEVFGILKHDNWFYFTSSNSHLFNFIKIIDKNFNSNILEDTTIRERTNTINSKAKYTDIMVIKKRQK